jgi:transcriptional regulator with XRE-family HTH domain
LERTVRQSEHRRLCDLLRDLRVRAGLSQGELAADLGLTQSWVSKLDAGEVRLDLVQLRGVFDVLDVDLVAFVKAFARGDESAARIRRRTR